MQFKMPINQQFFDQKDFANPVKSEINNDQLITLNKYMSTTILMKISENYLLLNDEWITNMLTPVNISYVDYRFGMTSIGMPDATPL